MIDPQWHLFKAFVLGVVEGLTEFLPVSSTGHLILVGKWIDFASSEAKVFEVVIQLGSILAVMWIFRKRLAQLIVGTLTRKPLELAFTRNVLIRTARETNEAAFGKGYSLEDRARLVAPAIALGVLTAAQSQVSEWRDALLNPGGKKEQSNVQKVVSNLSRAGAFGNADPFINLAMSARYKRELTSALTGPYLTAYLDSLNKMTFGLLPKAFGGPNSPNTNNAEWQASKAAYESILSPLITAAASYAPGGPMLRVGYGAGTIAATAPGSARKFADTVAGPRDVAPGAAKADRGSGGSDALKDMMR